MHKHTKPYHIHRDTFYTHLHLHTFIPSAPTPSDEINLSVISTVSGIGSIGDTGYSLDHGAWYPERKDLRILLFCVKYAWKEDELIKCPCDN